MTVSASAKIAACACPQHLGGLITQRNEDFLALPRAGGDAESILAAKFSHAFWRQRALSRLLTLAEHEARDGRLDQGRLADNLVALNLHLQPAQRKRAEALFKDRSQLARVLAGQGQRLADVPEYHEIAGPDMDLKIKVNRSSAWPFSKWRQLEQFAEYQFEGDGVRYRGWLLRPGDVLLANVNLDGNAVYTSLSEPKGYCPHSAMFTVLEHAGRRYPAVIETYEKGARAIPLNVFLNSRYLAYGEIYRYQKLTDAQRAELTSAAHALIADARGYNFYTCDNNPEYVSCTSLIQVLFAAVGAPQVEPVSTIGHPGIRENLGRLGYATFDPFFAPVDFLLNPDFECVGWIDNNQLPRLVARELVEHGFRRQFERGQLNPRRAPLMHHINHFGIRQMRRRTPLGKVISMVMGFDHISLPYGPDPMLAIVTPAEAQLGGAVRRLLPTVEQYLQRQDRFELAELKQDSAIQAAIDKHVQLKWL